MKVLELYAGSRSIGKVAEKRGHTVFSVDIKEFEGIDLAADIEHLRPEDIPFKPDVIWASPPCTTYSLAAISHHRDGVIPKSDFAKKSDRLIKNTIALIEHWPDAIFYIENPMGMLRKMPFMATLPWAKITYCRYGDHRMKPTLIWSNNIRTLYNPSGWIPRPPCHNNNPHCHHERAPRGSKTGTQGLKGSYERSKIPEQLCESIIEATEYTLKTKHLVDK